MQPIYTPYNFPGYPWADGENSLSYHLDSLAKSYLGIGKDERLLNEAAKAMKYDPKSDLWRLPSKFVGPYAEADAKRTRDVFLLQVPKLKEAQLWDLFELECSLLPLPAHACRKKDSVQPIFSILRSSN